MAHAERIDETLQRNTAAAFDRGKEIAHRGFAVALDLLELKLVVALLQREDVGGLLHPPLVEEVLKLFLAEPVDIEGAPRDEQFQMFGLLERTGELAADTHRLQLSDRRERAGAPDLDLDVLEHRHGALGRKFVRNGPARRARDEAEPLLPVDPVDLVDDAVDVVVELGALFLDLAVKRDQMLDGMTELCERVGL